LSIFAKATKGGTLSTWRGDQLKAAREAAGLSQFNLATKIDVSQVTIERWEKGEQVPSGAVLADLADAVAIDPTEFFDGTAAQGSYRTHSRISESQHMGPGQAQEQAELAKLRQQVLDAEDSHARALADYRRSDPWDRDREAERLHQAGDLLAALSAKLKAHEAP
jgi:transcriptional regulator with XRE-family HTH domain